MIDWLSDRMPAHDAAHAKGPRTDKPIMRAHLAHIARRRHLVRRHGEERGIAADLLIARRHSKP